LVLLPLGNLTAVQLISGAIKSMYHIQVCSTKGCCSHKYSPRSISPFPGCHQAKSRQLFIVIRKTQVTCYNSPWGSSSTVWGLGLLIVEAIFYYSFECWIQQDLSEAIVCFEAFDRNEVVKCFTVKTIYHFLFWCLFLRPATNSCIFQISSALRWIRNKSVCSFSMKWFSSQTNINDTSTYLLPNNTFLSLF
jgi:hypothetical protein